MAKDPRFQALKEVYKDKNYSDDHIAQALQLCREYHGYNDDWYPETPAQKGVFTRFMNNYLVDAKLSKTKSDLKRDSLYNLYHTLYSLYTPEQLEHRVNMIANDFSEMVDRIVAADKTGRTRQQIILAQGDKEKNGFVRIMEKVFDIYEKTYCNPEARMEVFDKKYPNATAEQRQKAKEQVEYRAREFRTILANKERLAAIAAPKIGAEEGFVVNIKNFEVIFEEPSENTLNENTESQQTDGTDREEGSKGDRFADFRTLKLLETLSVKARKLISKIPKVDSNGKIVRDDLGKTQFIGGRTVAVVLKKALVNSTPDSMMSDLIAAADFHPWIKGLADMLSKNPDYQATIYDNFKNAETTYVYISFENGSYVPKIANSRAAGYALMREAGNNLRAGYVPNTDDSLVTGYGALKSLEQIRATHQRFQTIKELIQSDFGTKWIRMVDKDRPATGKYIDNLIAKGEGEGKNLSYIGMVGEDAMSEFLDQNPNLAEQLASLLRGMGFNVSAEDVKTVAKQTMNKKGFGFVIGNSAGVDAVKGRNKLYHLVEYMDWVYSRAEEIARKGDNATGQYLFNTSGGFQRINRCLALSQYKEVEARVVNEGKSLSTYNNVNLLHQVFDKLANKSKESEEAYQAMLENEYSRYEGMSLGFGSNRQIHGWLKMFSENTDGFRDNVRVADIASFNHVEYFNLTRPQKLTCSLMMYLNGENLFQKDGYAAYEVPIQSDYETAYNFVFAPRLDVEGENSELVDAVVNEVLIELERISSIEARQKDDNRTKLKVYEDQGLRFQIFPEFNNNGFREGYKSQATPDEAIAFVRQQVVEQLDKIVEKDFQTISDAGILANPAMKKVNFGSNNYKSMYSENGLVSDLSNEAKDKLREYCLNTFYARLQMIKLLTGGIEQFNGLIDYEKRNMLTHATRTSLYTKATWKGKRTTTINGIEYKNSKETQNVVYIEDDNSESAFLDDIKEMLNGLLDEKVISQNQYDTMVKAYSKIKTTDGQGFRTLESYRTVQIMNDNWDDEHEEAFKNIMAGKPRRRDIDVFMQNIKPVLTGYEHIEAAVGENQKPVKLTVLHKYSEQVLLPMALASHCLQAKTVSSMGLDMAQQRLKKLGKEVDMFLFHSGVKVGAHTIAQPFAKTKDGERILKDADSIADYIESYVSNISSAIHTLPFSNYGIAASTTVHVADDKIAWASQAEKVAWANILRGQKISVAGREMDAWDARELYFGIKTANIIEEYKKLRELFVNGDELERVLQEEVASKAYSSPELKYALAHLKDGSFAVPLYSPNVEHQVQELLSSIIKKRLTKPRVKGANILQATGLGLDIEASMFDNTNSISKDDKLGIVFEGKGKNRRIKYVEVFIPIHDSRLKMFADKDGTISPEKLRELEGNGTIPASMLEFICYRTPSDAEHSVIPCRIKGFIANTGGATIIMPKEIMVMTGHDYDGDKMRCHFKNFRIVDKDNNEIYLSDEELVQMMLGQLPVNKNFRKVDVEQYDYDKSPLENSVNARNNARVELMFSQLTSVDGSRRMIIPGGCDDSKVVAKSMYLVRAARDEDARNKIFELIGQSPRNSSELYDILIRKSDGALTDIMRGVSSLETPYTVTHAADAFDYIMGGAQMIGIYATYNSALQMLQRVNMSYVPKVTKKGKQYRVTIFGNTFDKLFQVKNHNGRLGSLSLARLLNAAVDNNKDPILGYLNQTKEMSEMTFLMLAAGMTEEEVHLIMNQPAVIQLINRLKARDSKGMIDEIKTIVAELSSNNPAFEKLVGSQWIALENVSKMGRESFTSALGLNFSDVKASEDMDLLENQISILQTLAHLEPAASNLATFVRMTRPESESGAIGTTVASILAKEIELNKFREKINTELESELRISGMKEILDRRDVHEGWDTSYIEEILGTNLPEVVALNSLMLDTSLDMLSPFFPQAKAGWYDIQNEIASGYSHRTVQEGTMKKIGQEMILWKLLSNKKFTGGDISEEQRRIIIDVPKQLQDLQIRIAKAKENPGIDAAADDLVGNAFLDKLTTTSPENSNTAPRIMFSLNGAAVEGTADLIRSSWGYMLNSSDESIKKLAIDLFKYNIYTNGLSFGMYEFAHFAPFSVMAETPNFIEALQDVIKTKWSDEEAENFINQYYMNHWGDSNFLPHIDYSELKTTTVEGEKGKIYLLNTNDKDTLDAIAKKRYVVITSGENGSTQVPYRVEKGNNETPIVLVKAEKLVYHNRNQQVTLQYNPSVNYYDMKPVVPGNDSAWGQLDSLNVYAQANINAANPRSDLANNAMAGTGFFGLQDTPIQMQKLEEKAESAVEKNKSIDSIPMMGGFASSLGLGVVDEEAMKKSVVGTGTEEGGSKLLMIVSRDEEGNIVSQSVPATPTNIEQARKQEIYVKLNAKLRDILRKMNVSVGVLTDAEARLSLAGIADFDTANVTAEGLLELIRIANGSLGEYALPEEFAHVALEMLGHNHPLVRRLLNALNNNDEALREAFGRDYDTYMKAYEGKHDMMVLEAAGKLVAKELLRQQEIETKPLRKLINRIVEAIKAFLRKFNMGDVQSAIFEANDIASKLAQSLFGGKILDQMSINNIQFSGKLLSDVKVDLTHKNDILSKILKNELKRLAIFKKKLAFVKKEESSPAIDATEKQIAKLESAIRNYKTEEAIITYMNDAVEFLKRTNDKLDEMLALNASNGGEKANIVCRRLNTVRDTLFSFAKVIDDVNKAIEDGEIQDSEILTDAINKTSGVLTKFFQKYNSIAKIYFEEMLSNVYGKDGVTVTIGKNKGRQITIKEMARRLDRDLGFMSRWFNAIADCNDYVLKAIDDVTRSAKIRARRKAEEVRPRIEVAVDNLYRATGSRNQEFMFEKDAKGHKTGRYISKEDALKLPKAEQDFYNTMMEIKSEVDAFMPESLLGERKIVMLRKSTVEKFKSADGIGDKALAYWESFKNRFVDTSDNFDDEYEYVDVDFEGNKVDRIPIKFMNKGKNESYDDMTDDVAMSIMAYAGMGFEYSELNNVISVLENAKYMASQREVAQTTGDKAKVESRVTDNYEFTKPFTVSAARSRAQEALEDFFQMHLYGHIQKAEGTIGKTKISKRKVVDFLNMLASYSQMAINLPQRIANVSTGFSQIVIETAGKGVFNARDVAWASGIYTKMTGDRLADTGRTESDNKLSLWDIRFDVHQDNGRNVSKYGKSWISRTFNSSLLFAGLTAGEDYLANITSLAAAKNYKVLDANGKESNLWEAYEVKYLDPKNKTGAHLELKKGWTKTDGTPITIEDEQKFMKHVAGLNFELQGIYNLDDRSAIQQYAFGALIIMYRKWIAPSLKRRYGKTSFSVLKGEETEGYYRTLGRTLWKSLQEAKDAVSEEKSAWSLLNIISDFSAYRTAYMINKSKMTPYELSNLKRAWTDATLVTGLFIACALLTKLPPEDEDGKKELTWFESMLLSQLLRLKMELGSQAPTPFFLDEAGKILKSPFAAISPLKSTIDAYNLLLPYNYFTEIKSGRYKGHTRAYKYFREFPLISMYKKVENFVDPSPLLNFYKNDTIL